MKETIRSRYFIVLKLIGIGIFFAYRIMNSQEDLMAKAYHGLYMAIFLVFAAEVEMVRSRKILNYIIIGEGILTLVGVFLFPVSGIVFGIITVLDVNCAWKQNPYVFALNYIWLLPYYKITGNFFTGFSILTFASVVFFQEKCIVEKYRSVISEEELAQMELKTDIEIQNKSHQQEMKKSHLKFENQMLEERNRISQALHDKLGHSINGSIYQLEAAKLMVQGKPEECQKIVQGVINQLRQSMDEIRAILRSERPDKQKMAQLSLRTLCEECESQYQIKTRLRISDNEHRISDKNWEIILDNTYEAVTNALKYAQCRNIDIEILVLNEVVRCTIKDDGKGAENIEEGMGISGMKQRVRGVKGYIDISSEFGFTINMILPL